MRGWHTSIRYFGVRHVDGMNAVVVSSLHLQEREGLRLLHHDTRTGKVQLLLVQVTPTVASVAYCVYRSTL